MLEAEFWVAVAFVVFVGILAYFGIHETIAARLDQRIARIKSELDEASFLKAEARALLAECKRKKVAAENEAESVIAAAKAEAERLGAEAKTRLEELISRRTTLGESRIAQAEAKAFVEVRAAAAEAAAAAAESILARVVRGNVAAGLVSRAVDDLRNARLTGRDDIQTGRQASLKENDRS